MRAHQGTPGEHFVFHRPKQAYFGANRMLRGVQIANSTFGSATFKWMLLCDDDNFIVLSRLLKAISALDSDKPLFLGRICATASGSCQPNSSRRSPFCCEDFSEPCPRTKNDLETLNRSSWVFETDRTFVRKDCSKSSEIALEKPFVCCPVSKATSGPMFNAGFPFQYNPHGHPVMDGIEIWPTVYK